MSYVSDIISFKKHLSVHPLIHTWVLLHFCSLKEAMIGGAGVSTPWLHSRLNKSGLVEGGVNGCKA